MTTADEYARIEQIFSPLALEEILNWILIQVNLPLKMIKIERFTELSSQTKEQLDAIVEGEFGHIPIVKQTSWAIPDRTIIYYINDEIASFYNVIVRKISIDEDYFNAAGINNVITSKEFRGKGLSTKILSDTLPQLFDDLNLDLGLLLCADDLQPFYNRLGWYKIDCPVFFDQPAGKKLWRANTMLLTPSKILNPQKIDLNGLPW